ncbi:hypothetical protein [Petrocella sp. FN5]|uniref:hypothetical protein n=1 Tax=Petrocella sp. FN5 TaxID=3032002 RepID=UPI0023DC200A|nr:hypothetical protein [Petrocella sp. FN5]MDF1617740.1 hypothetical protein [Petrocella sp. FN5]
MIKAYKSGFIKLNDESAKRKGNYLVIEMTVKSLSFIHLIIISQDGLVFAEAIDSMTEITGYHRYKTKSQAYIGAGELIGLDTKDKNGMIEGLTIQLGFNYHLTAQAFGEGLLKLSGQR